MSLSSHVNSENRFPRIKLCRIQFSLICLNELSFSKIMLQIFLRNIVGIPAKREFPQNANRNRHGPPSLNTASSGTRYFKTQCFNTPSVTSRGGVLGYSAFSNLKAGTLPSVRITSPYCVSRSSADLSGILPKALQIKAALALLHPPY